MNNEKLCCGIDVSQNSLDVAYQNNLGEIFILKLVITTRDLKPSWNIPAPVIIL